MRHDIFRFFVNTIEFNPPKIEKLSEKHKSARKPLPVCSGIRMFGGKTVDIKVHQPMIFTNLRLLEDSVYISTLVQNFLKGNTMRNNMLLFLSKIHTRSWGIVMGGEF